MSPVVANCFILDIGKTNIKAYLLDEQAQILWQQNTPNQSYEAQYRYFDVDAIWQWVIEALTTAVTVAPFTKINVSTHGACAALLDKNGQLVLPVMDYEQTIPQDVNQAYGNIRDDFSQTFSPDLPMGLNLGRQLYWQKHSHPAAFSRVDCVLPYAQYWVWRLTGVKCAEITSLGCHTDLWLPQQNKPSSLWKKLSLEHALPPIKAAYDVAGNLLPGIRQAVKLDQECQVFCGVHDSNAGFARYIYSLQNTNLTLISTGTWVLCMSLSLPQHGLDPDRDMLANISVHSQVLPCAKFMGGREFERICAQVGSPLEQSFKVHDLQQLIDQQVYALPSFSQSGGPFMGLKGQIIGDANNGKALATLYLALMIDYELTLLGAHNDIVLGSSAVKNPLLCALLAQLRPSQKVLLSGDLATTVIGAWSLTRWHQDVPESLQTFSQASALSLRGLIAYRDNWVQLAESRIRVAS
ncbi:hypothetical protein H8B19_06270 [Neptunicella marina]|uniref:L-fuculose kinase n=1 Tax=Neptunicella marina TaxID=2125989 RepID=A0A8J6IPE5_9ALTE|nr:hypothetical protein [Neptunicella marina]